VYGGRLTGLLVPSAAEVMKWWSTVGEGYNSDESGPAAGVPADEPLVARAHADGVCTGEEDV